MALRNKKNKAFGMDISDSSIKICELGKHHGKIVPVAFADTPLNEKILNNHIIVNEGKLAEAIKKGVKAAKHIDTQFVVCSILEARSFVRTLKLPKMPMEEIGGAIPFELEQDIPIPIDAVYLDWQMISQTTDHIQLLVNASPKDYVDGIVNSIKQAGFMPVALELAASATARALVSTGDENKDVLIVDIGGAQTNFIIVEKNIITYSSSIPVAGHALTENIAKQRSVNMQAAEKLKLIYGLTSSNDEVTLRDAVLPILDNIIDEIKNVEKFFQEHNESQNVFEQIYVCGGSARVPGLVDYISARLNLSNTKNIPVISGNPWNKITGYDPKQPNLVKPISGLSFTASIGLALRGLDYEED